MTKLHELTESARRLSAEECAQLIELLWDSLEPESSAPVMPEWHRSGLDERLAEHVANPDTVVPWDEARERLAARRRP